MPRRIGISVGFTASSKEREELLEKVRIADQLGVDSIWAAEAWGREAVVGLTQLVLNTKRAKIGTAILNVFSRSPGLMAQTFATLDELSGGRMLVGLGTSGAYVIEHWHGMKFDKPVTRMREYAEIMNMAMRKEKLVYHGKVFNLERGFTLQNFDPVRNHIPIFFATLADDSIRLTGEVADGWIPTYWPSSRMKDGIALLAEGARKAGRDPKGVTVAPATQLHVVKPGDDPQKVRMDARQPIAFYIGRMGVFYTRMLTRNGYGEECKACQAAWDRRDPPGALAAISDKMLDDIAIIGDVKQCAAKLDERAKMGVELPLIGMPQGTPKQAGDILEALLK
ncbi:MAG: LLM class flavin-dependent oxidoreductase [Chloroflexi bacterium]|nr:LLM class flavin-dependent oxidoreductase [Chloroflexota bacterium]